MASCRYFLQEKGVLASDSSSSKCMKLHPTPNISRLPELNRLDTISKSPVSTAEVDVLTMSASHATFRLNSKGVKVHLEIHIKTTAFHCYFMHTVVHITYCYIHPASQNSLGLKLSRFQRHWHPWPTAGATPPQETNINGSNDPILKCPSKKCRLWITVSNMVCSLQFHKRKPKK